MATVEWHRLPRAVRVCSTPSLLRETALILLLSGLVFLLITRFLGESYQVDGHCMEPRLYTGERVLGEKLTFVRRAPRRGDIVVFRYPPDPAQLYIKRIVAVGGEVVEMRAGRVFINGKPLPESYLMLPSRGDLPPHRVIDGRYFVLGDNRAASDDSRYWGDVAKEAIVARAGLRYWPLERWKRAF